MTLGNTATFETTEFLFAAFLRANGIIYLHTEWRTPHQATFIFKLPPETLITDWQKADDAVSARALYDSLNFFRDEMRRSNVATG